jgi:hypothetical protein
MTAFYEGVNNRRGVGRSRIAVIRKIFNITCGEPSRTMRCMILHGELYWGKDDNNYLKKLSEFEKIIHKSSHLEGCHSAE